VKSHSVVPDETGEVYESFEELIKAPEISSPPRRILVIGATERDHLLLIIPQLKRAFPDSFVDLLVHRDEAGDFSGLQIAGDVLTAARQGSYSFALSPTVMRELRRRRYSLDIILSCYIRDELNRRPKFYAFITGAKSHIFLNGANSGKFISPEEFLRNGVTVAGDKLYVLFDTILLAPLLYLSFTGAVKLISLVRKRGNRG